MHEAVIGLGGNLGSSAALLEAAIALLGEVAGLRVRARSRLYRTPPLGPVQPEFRNAAVRVGWVGSGHGLLDALLFVEQRLGRERRERWGPRTVDLDLLWWSGGAVDTPRLRVPHPGLLQRSFALAPLLDVAPDLAAAHGATLVDLGGPPPARPWPVPAPLDRPSGPHDDAAHAVSAAASALCALLPPTRGPLWVLPWNPTPSPARYEGGPRTLWEPLARLLAPVALGFAPCAALVTEATGARWRGLLLARPLSSPGPLPPVPRRLALEKDASGCEAWLTLLPESV